MAAAAAAATSLGYQLGLDTLPARLETASLVALVRHVELARLEWVITSTIGLDTAVAVIIVSAAIAVRIIANLINPW